MEDPAAEITPIIHLLCQSPPSLQKQAIERYFARDAVFIHPICRAPTFNIQANINLGPCGNSDNYTCSRSLIIGIFRWYKILSPKIELEIESVGQFVQMIQHYKPPDFLAAFDSQNLILYVTLHQLFKIFFLPRFMASRAQLTTKLTLRRTILEGQSTAKYLIVEQNDLYQVNQFLKFLDPLSVLGLPLIALHVFASLVCLFGQWILAPISWWEDTQLGR